MVSGSDPQYCALVTTFGNDESALGLSAADEVVTPSMTLTGMVPDYTNGTDADAWSVLRVDVFSRLAPVDSPYGRDVLDDRTSSMLVLLMSCTDAGIAFTSAATPEVLYLSLGGNPANDTCLAMSEFTVPVGNEVAYWELLQEGITNALSKNGSAQPNMLLALKERGKVTLLQSWSHRMRFTTFEHSTLGPLLLQLDDYRSEVLTNTSVNADAFAAMHC